MPALPSSLSLTSIADGSAIIASDHRTNYAAIQAAVNAVITALSGGTAGQVLKATSASAVAYGSVTTTSAIAGGPPGSPSDTDIWIAHTVDAGGTRWAFQYSAGSGSPYKWESFGGPGLLSAGTSATQGIVLPRAGDYTILWTVDATASLTSFQTILTTTSGSLASGNASGLMTDSVNGQRDMITGIVKVTGVSAGATVAHGISGHSSIQTATLLATPTRVS